MQHVFITLRSVIFLGVMISQALAWKEYAEPIVWPSKQADPFVFDMNFEWTLTMSYPTEYGLIEMVDYFPDEFSTGSNCSLQGDRLCAWYVRNKDQLMACNLKDPLTNISLLNGVLQLHGLHQRVATINGVRFELAFFLVIIEK